MPIRVYVFNIMIKYSTKRSKPITEDNILARTTEYDIFSYYIGSSFIVGSKFNSPLRKDKSPSFGIFVSKKTNSLLFKDQSTGIVGNCFKFVQLKENLKTYREALEKVNKDLNLDLLVRSNKGVHISTNYKASKTTIQIKIQKFVKVDFEYWESYHIDRKLLKKYNVYSISHVWVNGMMLPWKHTVDTPMYAYQVYNKFKIYRPLADKAEKWLSNCTQYDIQGYQQLKEKGDLLIITKSLKDVLVLTSLGYNAISANSENTMIPDSVIKVLKERFKEIIIFFDNDEGGITGAESFKTKHNFKTIIIPHSNKIKDISDYIQKNGIEKTKQILQQIIK